jgi:hypothetical protein
MSRTNTNIILAVMLSELGLYNKPKGLKYIGHGTKKEPDNALDCDE